MSYGGQTRKLLYFMRIGAVIAPILFVWAEYELRTSKAGGTGFVGFPDAVAVAAGATILVGNCFLLRLILSVNSVGSAIEACFLLAGTLLYPVRVLTCFAF